MSNACGHGSTNIGCRRQRSTDQCLRFPAGHVAGRQLQRVSGPVQLEAVVLPLGRPYRSKGRCPRLAEQQRAVRLQLLPCPMLNYSRGDRQTLLVRRRDLQAYWWKSIFLQSRQDAVCPTNHCCTHGEQGTCRISYSTPLNHSKTFVRQL